LHIPNSNGTRRAGTSRPNGLGRWGSSFGGFSRLAV